MRLIPIHNPWKFGFNWPNCSGVINFLQTPPKTSMNPSSRTYYWVPTVLSFKESMVHNVVGEIRTDLKIQFEMRLQYMPCVYRTNMIFVFAALFLFSKSNSFPRQAYVSSYCSRWNFRCLCLDQIQFGKGSVINFSSFQTYYTCQVWLTYGTNCTML